MCYEVLRADEVTDRSLVRLLRLEFRDAVINGLEAAALVALVLLWQGVALPLVVLGVAAAVPLGVLVHQVVLVCGALFLRARARRSDGTPTVA